MWRIHLQGAEQGTPVSEFRGHGNAAETTRGMGCRRAQTSTESKYAASCASESFGERIIAQPKWLEGGKASRLFCEGGDSPRSHDLSLVEKPSPGTAPGRFRQRSQMATSSRSVRRETTPMGRGRMTGPLPYLLATRIMLAHEYERKTVRPDRHRRRATFSPVRLTTMAKGSCQRSHPRASLPREGTVIPEIAPLR